MMYRCSKEGRFSVRRLLIVLLALSAAGCKGADGSSAAAAGGPTCNGTSLLKDWSRGGGEFHHNLTTALLNGSGTYVYQQGSWGAIKCSGSISMNGNSCAGTMVISGMVWNGQGQATDPDCAGLNATHSYSITNGVMTTCLQPNGYCADYN
jgi:hypothetical protein